MNLLTMLLAASMFSGLAGCDENTTGGYTPLPHNSIPKYEDGGLLFAHMKDSDYGGLYYYISRDGARWEVLNENQTIDASYSGHPDIMKGRDGRYYMIAGKTSTSSAPTIWVSTDLLNWSVGYTIPKSIFTGVRGYEIEHTWFGAPKMFYDSDSDQYMISWHMQENGLTGEDSWRSMRTFYILTSDFVTYTEPKQLFNFTSEADKDMAQIDAIIRKIDGKYYAIIKDERWPKNARKTGKTIRIAKSDNLTGPYGNPGPPVTPVSEIDDEGNVLVNRFHEAPILVPSPTGGWFIYAEKYPTQYNRFDAAGIESDTWTQFYLGIPDSRHGAMIRIDQTEYDALKARFGK